MDPLSQGVLGAVAAQSAARRPEWVRAATWVGFFSGMAADLDVFIRSAEDPLLFLQYHRHFTHSLFFIPWGGLICALVFWAVFFRKKLKFSIVLLFAVLGYATHGLLDACTSYGTQLLWPFSSARISWDSVSIVDPLFTLPLLFFMLKAAFSKKAVWGRVAVVFSLAYMALGFFQNHRAREAAHELAISRGHQPVRLEAKPTFGNLLVWKTLYENESVFYVDAVRLAGAPQVLAGSFIPKLDLKRDLPWLDLQSRQAVDLKRFAWFSQEAVALKPDEANVVMDVRYSVLPQEISPLWGIRMNPENPESAVRYETFRSRSWSRFSNLWNLISGQAFSANPPK